MAQIALEGLGRTFGGVVAVQDLDLRIDNAELVALLGPSGCGKTTTLLMLAGIYRPTQGLIRFDGVVVNALPPQDRNVGMVFQSYALYPHMSVFDNIAFPLRLARRPRDEMRRRVGRVAEMVQIDQLLERKPGQLSGGQQQRVALARALVLNPDILLLDEPLSNLDAKIRVQVRAEIRKLQQELGITTIYVTHDQEEALSLSDRVAIMKDGRVLQVGRPKELYERPRTRFVADFVGTNNLVPGRVSGRAGAELMVDTAVGTLRAVSDVAVGERCILAIRPENVAVDAGVGSGAGNVVRGRVSFVSYLGSALRYDVEAGSGQILKADIRDPWHHEPLSIGREVAVSFPASVTLAVAEDD
jgi:ABC-type Fe3+/spermidine/putrescine transport system ATPase subunit